MNIAKILFSLIVFMYFQACTPKPEQAEKENFSIQREVVMEGLKHPWSMAFLSEEEAIVAEKDGQLIRVNLKSQEKNIIENFPQDLVDSIRIKDKRDNSGIFEVLLDPNFQTNQWIYISYAAEGDGGSSTKVIRAKFREDALSEVEELLLASPFSPDLFHYGGGMTFGPDGKLYITVGERYYNEIDQPSLPIAQDVKDRRGMIYRLNSDGSIPDDNPDFGEGAIPGAYAIGIRAAQGITVEPSTGFIWFSEHGSRQGDEINRLIAGANYGWPIVTTGAYRNEDYAPPALSGITFIDPIWYWKETVAPTGLAFYTGDEFPQWKNNLLVPGLSKGSLWRLELLEGKVLDIEKLFEEEPIRLRKVVQSPKGKLYLLTDEANGKILQIIRSSEAS